MKRLLILGCGGFGQEVASMLPAHPGFEKEWKMGGFLDSKDSFEGIPSKYPILGNEDTFEYQPDDLLIIAIMNPATKEKLMNKLSGRVNFYTFIHPSSMVFDFTTIGEGTVVYPNCSISSNVHIGKFVTMAAGTQIGHDARIGDFSSLMPHTDLGGGVQLGSHVFAGTKTTVLPYKSIANGVQIAAGSVVMRSVKTENITLAGNPAVKFE